MFVESFVGEERIWISNLLKVMDLSRRMNREKMGYKRVMYFMASFVVCFVLVGSSIGSKTRTEEEEETKFSKLNPEMVETPQRHEWNQGLGITPSLASLSSTFRVRNLDPPSSLSLSVPDPDYARVKPTTVRHLSETPQPPKKKNGKKDKKKKVKKKDDSMPIVVVVVVTAAITLSVVLLCLLCCCCKAFKSGSGGKKDERPLLSLSLSDYSSASSSSHHTGASLSNKKQGNQSFSDGSSHKQGGDDDLFKANSLSDAKIEIPNQVGNGIGMGSTESLSQKPPAIPGSPAIIPPLKPPPGRSFPPAPPPPVVSNAPPPPPPPTTKSPSSAPPPPPPPGKKNGPPPPPVPGKGGPPPPPIGLKAPRAPLPGRGSQTNTVSDGGGDDPSKTKLKPFFWDKVQANPDESMVWNHIKGGSFQFNEEMIETLFGCTPVEKSKTGSRKPSTSQDKANESVQLIEPKKAQNLAILLKALNVTTEEVCDALQEGNELPVGLVQTLLKMAPTPEEELKLRIYSGELSRLGNAERFLKIVIEIPFAFMRLESLLFMCTFREEEAMVRESFSTLEDACTELRKNRLFQKLLEAVLKTGNRMNDGTFRGGAQAFKLDTLLKLSDVKGKDGKTTLLHFVVQEIIRTEGARASRARRESWSFNSIESDDLTEDSPEESDHYRELGLQVVSRIGDDLESVKKAAVLDSDGLAGTVARFGKSLSKAKNFLNSEMKSVDEDNGFNQALKAFLQEADVAIVQMLEEEKRIMALVKSTADYFHGTAGKEEGLRIFVIVRDFLLLLEKVCKEVKVAPRKLFRNTMKRDDSVISASSVPPRQPSSSDPRQRLAPKIKERRLDSSSSDDEF